MSAGDDSGFLSRWARRKAAARSGAVVADAPQGVPPVGAVPRPSTPAHVPAPASAHAAVGTPAAADDAGPPRPPPPTLDDVAALTPEADFRRFVAGDVDPGVRNAAMKKLFTDPHYNVMDGLDIYIDDYGKPDPLPPGMLRRLAQSRFLGLFDDEPQAPPTPAGPAADPSRTHDENPDLRLQPDDAAGPDAGEPGRPDAGGDPAGER